MEDAIRDIFGSMFEAMLQGEMDSNLGYGNNERGEKNTIDRRKGIGSPCTGISFVDSAPLEVCDTHRICQHKVFAGTARRGKSPMGWFYGFKSHLVINGRGDILAFCLRWAMWTTATAKP